MQEAALKSSCAQLCGYWGCSSGFVLVIIGRRLCFCAEQVLHIVGAGFWLQQRWQHHVACERRFGLGSCFRLQPERLGADVM